MALIQAAVLGIIQGLTEFLPVSSSGHLILVRETLGWNLLADTHLNTLFDLAVHAGTFVGVFIYFWPDVQRYVMSVTPRGLQDRARDQDRRLAFIILVATIPAATAGILGNSAIETHLREAPMIVAGLLIAFGIILWLAEWRGSKVRELGTTGWVDGVLIGLAQALSLAPGVSRSGITMTVGLARGMTRESAARFSFLLSIPIIGGAALYGATDLVQSAGALPEGSLGIFAMGFATAALSGYLCIRYFLRYLQRHAFRPFVIYRVLVGVFLLAWFGIQAG